MSHDRHLEEEKPFLDEERPESDDGHLVTRRSRQRRGQGLVVVPWILSVVSWLVTLYLLLSKSDLSFSLVAAKDNSTSLTTNAMSNHYWPTDLEAMRPSIEYETRVFTGALIYNETTKRFFRNMTNEGLQFVGPPNDAIDDAWETLLHHEFIPFTEEESLPYRPELKTFNAKYRFEPDVFHSLHCVNELRKRIDADYYTLPEHADHHLEQEDWDRIHIDHCIDQVRQTIMCFGDLSPVPLYSWDGAPLGIGRSTTHTCRKWEPIKQWANQRRIDESDPVD